jgi:hypothetical protein
MEHTKEELTEASRQIESTLHKLRETIGTLEAKPRPERYKSQLTLARRRVQAFALASDLIAEKLREGELS